MEKEIKLDEVLHARETALVGRENGEETLSKLINQGNDLENIEKKFDKIIVKIPERIVSVNKSYFLGLFELSVERLGREEFEKKYNFETTDYIKGKIKSHINAACLSASQGEILDV
jgi:hypothetical protein